MTFPHMSCAELEVVDVAEIFFRLQQIFFRNDALPEDLLMLPHDHIVVLGFQTHKLVALIC